MVVSQAKILKMHATDPCPLNSANEACGFRQPAKTWRIVAIFYVYEKQDEGVVGRERGAAHGRGSIVIDAFQAVKLLLWLPASLFTQAEHTHAPQEWDIGEGGGWR